MDGLLLDTERVSFRIHQEVAKRYDMEFTLTLYRRLIGRRLVDSRKEFLGELDLGCKFDSFFIDVDNAYSSFVKEGPIPLKSGVLELLDFIDSKGLVAGVATSTNELLAKHKLSTTGLLDYMHSVTSGDQVDNGKPAPDIFLKAAETMGFHPSECLVLEDSEAGVRGAYTAQMMPVMIPDLQEPSEETQRIASHIFPSLNDFLSYFRERA